jgi:hypothetical protein
MIPTFDMRGNDGGKGSSPRPKTVSDKEYAERWDAIFARDKEDSITMEMPGTLGSAKIVFKEDN